MPTPSCAGLGYSQNATAEQAGREAAAVALAAHADGPPPVVAFVYGTVAYEQEELLRGVRAVLRGVPIVGASTQGVVRTGDASEVERSVGVALLRSAHISARTASVSGIGAAAEDAGRRLGRALKADGPVFGDDPLLVWYDPLTGVNVEAMLRGLAAEGFPCVVGGAAGQPWGPMNRTYQYFDHEALCDSVVALRLSGTGGVLHDATHGTEAIGLEVTVTDAHDNVIRAIDGQPALDVWQQQIGTRDMGNIDDVANWALGVALPAEAAALYEGPITRSVFRFNAERREIVLQAPIATGTRALLCHRTPAAVYDRAMQLADRMREGLAGRRAVMALSFECGGRPGPFLGEERARQESIEIQARIDPALPWLGMYAWGEIFPVAGQSYFHNYTFPICIICDP